MSVSTACQSQLYVSLDYKGITKEFLKLHISLDYIDTELLSCLSQLYVSLDYKGNTKNFYSMIRMSISTTCQPRPQRYFV